MSYIPKSKQKKRKLHLGKCIRKMAADKVVANKYGLEKGDKTLGSTEMNWETTSVCLVDNHWPEFQFNTTVCSICNGYYGPCFGEPVCTTCHAFLFPNDIGRVQVPMFSEKTDDDDSGNDEPADLSFNAERRPGQQPQNALNNIDLLPPNSHKDLDREISSSYFRYALQNIENNHIFDNFSVVPFQNNVCPRNANKNPKNGDLRMYIFSQMEMRGIADQDLQDKSLSNPVNNALLPSGNESVTVNAAAISLQNVNFKPRLEDRKSDSHILSERVDLLSNYKHSERESFNESGLIERLPPEVLLVVFSHLDDVSLWSSVNVCRRWNGLLLTHITVEQWHRHVTIRWPLYRPVSHVVDWYKVYDKLASSVPCRTCLAQTSLRNNLYKMEETSWRKNRLRMELKSLQGDPPEGIKATPLDEMCCHWQATITGPVGSPYEGGIFYLYLQVPHSYPMCPPVVRFLTKILHPNVSRHGDVGIDSIHHNWSLALTISKVLISVQSLLTDPYCQICMEPELGEMYMKDREKFEEVARAWTWKYAMNDILLS